MHLHYYYLINLLSIIEKNGCRKGTVNIHTSLHLYKFLHQRHCRPAVRGVMSYDLDLGYL